MDAPEVVPGMNGNALHSIIDDMRTIEQQVGDFTVRDVSKETGLSIAQTRRRLDEKVEAGLLVKLWGKLNTGGYGSLYRPK